MLKPIIAALTKALGLAALFACLATSRAYGDVGVILNETLNESVARVTGSGHTAVYFSRICVDSVATIGEDDSLIPANVEQAANFYQTNGYLHGRPEIRAADPTRTKILGNIRFDYASNPIQCNGYSWLARAFEKPHIEIECDPNVINRVEELIRSRLPAAAPSPSTSAAAQ